MRWVFEGIRSEIRQYLVKSDQDEDPFGWAERSIVYQRVRNEEDKPPPLGSREMSKNPTMLGERIPLPGAHVEQ